MSGDFQLPPIRRPGKDPEPGRRPEPGSGRRPPDAQDRRPRDAQDAGGERTRTPDRGDRSRTPEVGSRPDHGNPGRRAAGRVAANPRTVGPWITLTGRVLREPQSTERAKPSTAPILVAAVLLALCLLLPLVLAVLGYVVILLLALVLITRRLPFGRGPAVGSRGREGQEKSRVLVTNFRVGVPEPDDPRTVGRQFSCRLLTPRADGAVELSGGDEVTIRGVRGAGGLVEVQTLTVGATRSRIKAAPGASPTRVAVTTLILLVLAGGALWFNRAWLAPEVLARTFAVIERSVVQLGTLVLVVLILAFVVRKVIFRR